MPIDRERGVRVPLGEGFIEVKLEAGGNLLCAFCEAYSNTVVPSGTLA